MRLKEIKFSPWYFYLPLAALWLLKFQSGYFLPKDDLLRHAVAYNWGYDYGIPYIESVFKPFYDYYPGFDLMMGWLHRHLGDYSLVIPQLLALSLAFWGLAKMLQETDPSLKLIALALMVRLTYGRFVLGRPSALCSSLMIFLMAYNGRLPGMVKIAGSLLLSCLYQFFFIYVGPLVLYDRKHLISLFSGLAFWLLYSQGYYFSEIYSVITSLGNQNMGVAENKTIQTFYMFAWVFTLPMIKNCAKDLKTFAIVLFYSLANQVRYVETIVPLVLAFFRYVNIKVPMSVAAGIACYLIISITPVKSPLMTEIPKHLPSGARVLSGGMGDMYQVLYRRPDLRVAPNYAYGWTDQEVQKLLKEIEAGTIDCGSNTIYRFEYLIESSLRVSHKACLELVAVEREKRLWKIVSFPNMTRQIP